MECSTEVALLEKKIRILKILDSDSEFSIKVLSKTDNEAGYSMYLGPSVRKEAALSFYPNKVSIIRKNISSTLLKEEIQARGLSILKKSRIVYGSSMEGVDIEKLLEIYFTIIEPNQQVGNCFTAYIAMMDWLYTADTGLEDLGLLSKYSLLLRKMIWPETRGISPVVGSGVEDFFSAHSRMYHK